MKEKEKTYLYKTPSTQTPFPQTTPSSLNLNPTTPPILQRPQIALLPTRTPGKPNIIGLPLTRPQGPTPAAHAAVRVDVRQVLASIRVVDVDGFGAAADVLDAEGAAVAVPFLVLDEGEG